MNPSDDCESRRAADGDGAPEHDRRQTKRPYRAPAILSREVWESVAGVCSGGYAKSTMPPCQGPIAS